MEQKGSVELSLLSYLAEKQLSCLCSPQLPSEQPLLQGIRLPW